MGYLTNFVCGLLTKVVLFLEGTIPIGPDAWSSILDALTAQISVQTVVGVIAAVVGAGIGLVFMWFGVRKLIAVIMTALKKGRLSV